MIKIYLKREKISIYFKINYNNMTIARPLISDNSLICVFIFIRLSIYLQYCQDKYI